MANDVDERASAPEKEPATASIETMLHALDARWPFGPTFFASHLAAFVRDRCPEPTEGLPNVRVHLATAEVLDLCHVIGLAPGWVALAVRDEGPGHAMRTELCPYAAIVRVTICAASTAGDHIGFEQTRVPSMLAANQSPEDALRAAASAGAIRPEG